ncbi:MAG: dihydroorotate dehydrogenase electron transfer subunit [Proteobacteria bacterium]|nr:dihydroorotate dehydrogenase electron transfer subunit [Pseudomonadota bacterium]
MSETSVIYNRALSENLYLMGLDWSSGEKENPEIVPGQFVMLKITDDYDPLLRRPFGIYGLLRSQEKTVLEIVYKVVGKGTKKMSSLTPGDRLDVMAPIGNGFPELKEGEELIMVAGGIGIAPFKLLAAKYPDSVLLFGARDASEAVLVNEIKDMGLRVKVATMDGSRGTKGLVTELMESEFNRQSVVFACGPLGMLRAVSKLSHDNRVKSFVSLERAMACGVGACLGCAVKTKHGDDNAERATFENLKMVCSDGPVFDGELIDWEQL